MTRTDLPRAHVLASVMDEPIFPVPNEKLLDAVFYDGAPVFKRPVAAHVKAWERHVRQRSWRLFHTNQAFRDAYRARGGEFGR